MEKSMLRLPVRYYKALPGREPCHIEEIIEVSRTELALVLVDVYCGVQEGEEVEVMSPGLTKIWNEFMERKLAPAVRAAREAQIPIIYVMNSAPRVCLKNWVLGEKLKKSFGMEFTQAFREGGVDPLEFHTGRKGRLAVHRTMEPQLTDLYIRKHVYSGFYETRLDTALRNLGSRYLVMAGLWADACLLATMLDALYRNYHVLILRDATLSGEDDETAPELPGTERQVRWMEKIIGCSLTCAEFQVSCERAIA